MKRILACAVAFAFSGGALCMAGPDDLARDVENLKKILQSLSQDLARYGFAPRPARREESERRRRENEFRGELNKMSVDQLEKRLLELYEQEDQAFREKDQARLQMEAVGSESTQAFGANRKRSTTQMGGRDNGPLRPLAPAQEKLAALRSQTKVRLGYDDAKQRLADASVKYQNAVRATSSAEHVYTSKLRERMKSEGQQD